MPGYANITQINLYVTPRCPLDTQLLLCRVRPGKADAPLSRKIADKTVITGEITDYVY